MKVWKFDHINAYFSPFFLYQTTFLIMQMQHGKSVELKGQGTGDVSHSHYEILGEGKSLLHRLVAQDTVENQNHGVVVSSGLWRRSFTVGYIALLKKTAEGISIRRTVSTPTNLVRIRMKQQQEYFSGDLQERIDISIYLILYYTLIRAMSACEMDLEIPRKALFKLWG